MFTAGPDSSKSVAWFAARDTDKHGYRNEGEYTRDFVPNSPSNTPT